MNLSIRVAHVIETLGRGGAEMALLRLLPVLRQHGVEASVLALDGSTEIKREMQADFVQAGVAAMFAPEGTLVDKAAWLRWQLWQQPVDVLHAHLTRSVLAAAWASRRLDARPALVGHLHNLGYEKPVSPRDKPRFWLKKFLARQAAARFDVWQAVSLAVKSHYRRHWRLPADCIHVIANPVPLPPALPPHRLELTPGREPLIVLPGRLVPEKGHDFAIDLARVLFAEGEPAKWLFAGGGPLLEALQGRIRAEGLHDVIQITGPLTGSQMQQRLAEATLVIQPSWQEGFGMTTAEAMALGKAVLVSDAGGLPDTVGDAGWIVPAGDHAAWRNAMRYLLDSPVARASLGQAARARVLARFAVDVVARQQLAVYHDMLPAAGEQYRGDTVENSEKRGKSRL